MACSRDQTCGNVLYGASDAALELDESKLNSFICGGEKNLINLILIKLRNQAVLEVGIFNEPAFHLPCPPWPNCYRHAICLFVCT